MPTLFLAPTAGEARRAAWEFVTPSRTAPQTSSALFDPPLVFCAAHSASSWRDLARQSGEAAAGQTIVAPRLIRAEAYFARAYASLARRRALSGADRLWVLQGAARRAARLAAGSDLEGELARIAAHRDSLQLAARHIAGLRRAHLTRFPAAPGADALQALLHAYNARLEALGAFDFEAAPALFPLAAERNRAFSWPRELLIDDELDPSPALQIGLDALIQHARCVAVTLVGPTEHNPALAGALEWWQGRGAILRVGDWQSAGARVGARILGDETEATAPRDLFLTSAHTPRDEMERVAVHIRAAVEAGARPDEFALGCADFARYAADARHAFAAWGVPLDWPGSAPLGQSPLVRALLHALGGAGQKLDVHALHEWFGAGTLRWNYGEKTLDARRLRVAALAARHPELDDLDATRAALERKRAQLARESRHDDARARTLIEASLAAGDLEMVAQFQELRAPLSEAATGGVWHARVLEIAGRLAAHWLDSDSPAGARAQHDLERFFCAAETVAARARGWDDAEEESPRAASEWMGWLRAEIEADAGSDASARGGVRVGAIDAGMGGARATFWCGLSEGAWPNSGAARAATRELEAILNAHRTAPLARATHHLARAAGDPAALYLSHARHLDGRETPASPLLDDLSAAFPGANWPQLPLVAPPGAAQNAATRRGVLQAWNGWFAGENPVSPRAALPLAEQEQLQTLARMRAARRLEPIGVYDGVLGARGRELMEARDQISGGARLSGSDLEFYARCPLRYFFERVLALRHAERQGDDIDARAAGTLVHEIAREWMMAGAGALQSGDFAAGLSLLDEITRANCERLPVRPILREAEWRRLMGFDGQSGPLVKWLRLELSAHGAWGAPMRPISHTGLRIAGLSSGSEGAAKSQGAGLEHRFEIDLGGHKIKGFIDRIDSSEEGAHLAVIDYKTGDIAGLPSWQKGDGGLHFQLAIYALALRNLPWEGAPPRLAMAYLSLKRAKIARGIGQDGTLGKGCSGAKSLDDAAFGAWLDDVGARAARIGDLRAAGVFNLSLQAPKDAKCSGCASKSLCGQHAPTQALRFEAHTGSPFVYLPVLREWEAPHPK